MKKIISLLIMVMVLAACGDDKAEAEQTKATDMQPKNEVKAEAKVQPKAETKPEYKVAVEAEPKPTAEKETVEEKIPENCEAYAQAVEQLAAKIPEAAKLFQYELEASIPKWKKLSGKQAEAANKGCVQMLNQIQFML